MPFDDAYAVFNALAFLDFNFDGERVIDIYVDGERLGDGVSNCIIYKYTHRRDPLFELHCDLVLHGQRHAVAHVDALFDIHGVCHFNVNVHSIKHWVVDGLEYELGEPRDAGAVV